MRRPSPALVIAVIALFAALGGTAYAGFAVPKNSVGSPQLKKNAVTTKKIKNGAVTAAKINSAGLTVPNAVHANSADTATSAASAANATHAATADTATSAGNGVHAYAHLLANGTVDSTLSSGITTAMVSHSPGTGIYCISGLGFTPKGVVVTPDSVNGPTSTQASVKSSAFVFCPTSDQVELVTYNPNTGAGTFLFTDRPVYLQLLG
jgi:hypothetical protein